MKGSCWDRFERKTLLCFTEYKDRVPGIMQELDRIGMKDVNVQLQFPNPFDRFILDHLRHERCLSVGFMNATLGHYSAIKKAYHLGLNSILVIEDDVRFLKDIGEIEKSVNALPEDFDIALFDIVLLGLGENGVKEYERYKTERMINDRWSSFDILRSQGCYAMSRRAMERYIWLNEAVLTDPRIGKLRIGDHFMDRKYMGKEMKMYFASKHVAIQRISGNNNSNSNNPYEGMDVDGSLYAE